MRAVATISFNPHPYSTFSGALFYYSVTPNVTANQCAAQASARAPRTVTTTQVAGVPFTHGYDEHGSICTESRDEIYTTHHNDTCFRFDAVINNFCGGDVSGVQDITERELNDVRQRMQSILNTSPLRLQLTLRKSNRERTGWVIRAAREPPSSTSLQLDKLNPQLHHAGLHPILHRHKPHRHRQRKPASAPHSPD